LQCLTSLTIRDNWHPKNVFAKQIYAISDFRRGVDEICGIWDSTLPKIPKESEYEIHVFLLD